MLNFYKYHGAGNDFILLDDRAGGLHAQFDQATIARWCDRHFGIGADGLMFLQTVPDHEQTGDRPFDFRMVYYNADGAPSSMCGNGGRCLVRFAADLGIEPQAAKHGYHFIAVDGKHEAQLLTNGNVALSMDDVSVGSVGQMGEDYVLDTGSPHYITRVDNTDTVDVVAKGRAVRYSDTFREKGVNVNFISGSSAGLRIATYERGVENETLACGTGATAAAIAALLKDGFESGPFRVPVSAKGGELLIRGKKGPTEFIDLWLEGPAVRVFTGRMAL